MNQFTYKGKKSYDDMDLIITETPSIVSPERDIVFTSIDGRNGDIIEDNGRFRNVDVEYRVAAIPDSLTLPVLARKIKGWLQGEIGYFVLTDTYDPLYFRYGCYIGNLNIEDVLQQIGNATLKFNCKPFKYSFDGQNIINITANTSLVNPEEFTSSPYIKIVGTGNVTMAINNTSFTFTGIDEYIEIDSEMMLAYKGTALQNTKINFTSFPKLAPGTNNISFTGFVTEIDIKPRWCAL